jgi:hypothetical protein
VVSRTAGSGFHTPKLEISQQCNYRIGHAADNLAEPSRWQRASPARDGRSNRRSLANCEGPINSLCKNVSSTTARAPPLQPAQAATLRAFDRSAPVVPAWKAPGRQKKRKRFKDRGVRPDTRRPRPLPGYQPFRRITRGKRGALSPQAPDSRAAATGCLPDGQAARHALR